LLWTNRKMKGILQVPCFDRLIIIFTHNSFLLWLLKGPAADAMDAPQPWGLLCNHVMKMISFFRFPCNGALVEWNWQGKIEVLGVKTCASGTLSTTNPTWTERGSNPGLLGERPTTNRLSHGTASHNSLWFFPILGRQPSYSLPLTQTNANGKNLCSRITFNVKVLRLFTSSFLLHVANLNIVIRENI
jgi:hypothetical protein